MASRATLSHRASPEAGPANASDLVDLLFATPRTDKDVPNGYPGLDSTGRLWPTDMPLTTSAVRSGSVASALTSDVSSTAGNLINLTLTGNVTLDLSNPADHQRVTWHLTASGAARTVTFGSSILEQPGVPSSFVIPPGSTMIAEAAYVGNRGNGAAWALLRVYNLDHRNDPAPMGLVGRRQRTSNSTSSSSTTLVGVMWCRAQVYAGRAYRIRNDGILIGASSANNIIGLRHHYTTDSSTPSTSSTALETSYINSGSVAGQSQQFFHTSLYVPSNTHVLSILLSFWRVTGSGTCTLQGSTASPLGMTIDDLGVAPAVSGGDV